MKTNLPFSNNRLHGEYRKNSRMISDNPNQHFFFRKNPLPGNGITTGHTGTLVPVYLYGACADRINGIMDNTDLPKEIAALMRLK